MEKFGIELPKATLPLYIIGAGGIVADAHLPAYRLAGFQVNGIYDIEVSKARALATKYAVSKVYESLNQLVADIEVNDCVFDVAVPGGAILDIIRKLPVGSNVLIQKPMGEDLRQAREILDLCQRKRMNAGINFQLRYAPFINEARKMIARGDIGELCDIDVNVNVFTPWHLWDFLFTASRVEILYHSIHYVDLIRSFWGNPKTVYAKTLKHPKMKELASVRTTIILDYGQWLRANIQTNHCHNFGLHNQHSYIKLEGTNGAIKINFGVLKNYPQGEPDCFEYVVHEEGKQPQWKTKRIDGTWFPHAFVGSMSEVMKAATGEVEAPDNAVEDCIHTMACVEAAYRSSELGGVEPLRFED